MLPGYTTNIAAHRPLLSLLDGLLLTSAEVGLHLRYSQEQLSNLRRAMKGPPFLKLPTGGVRYDSAQLMAWQLSGAASPLTLERVELAISACEAVPMEHRAAITEHLRRAFNG